MHSLQVPPGARCLSGPTVPRSHRRAVSVLRRCETRPEASSSQPKPEGQNTTQPAEHTDQADVMGSLSAVAKIQGRLGHGTSVVLASDDSEETWRKLDKKVNKYPGTRTFTAIGSGGSDFRAAMVRAVESVVGSVHEECISERKSSQQKYISVTVGPVWVQDCDQVLAIYAKMKEDQRLKYFI